MCAACAVCVSTHGKTCAWVWIQVVGLIPVLMHTRCTVQGPIPILMHTPTHDPHRFPLPMQLVLSMESAYKV